MRLVAILKRILVAIIFLSILIPVNGQTLLTKVLNQHYDNNTLVDDYETLYEYDSKGELLKEYKNLLINSTTRFELLDSFFYDSQRLEVRKRYLWDSNILKWKLSQTSNYNYNTNKLLNHIQHDFINGTSLQTYHDSFYYNLKNNIERRVLGNNKTSRWEYTYSSNSLLSKEVLQKFVNGTWKDDESIEFIMYNTKQQPTEIIYKNSLGSTTSGQKYRKDVLSYDNLTDSLKEETFYLWENNAWAKNRRTLYNYNTDKTLNEKIYQSYKNSIWENSDRDAFSYKTLSTSLDKVNKANTVKVYPNPTSGKFTIELGDAEQSAIIITDVTGKQVYTSKATDNLDMDLSHLQKGIYLVNIKSKESSSTQRIVVQ